MAKARIKGLPDYRGYHFVLVEDDGVYVRCPDGELVRARYAEAIGRGWYILGMVGTPDPIKTLQVFADRHQRQVLAG